MTSLKEYRQKAGLTQAALAAKIGTSVSTVSMWETGMRTPRFPAIIRMSKALGVPRKDLFDLFCEPVKKTDDKPEL